MALTFTQIRLEIPALSKPEIFRLCDRLEACGLFIQQIGGIFAETKNNFVMVEADSADLSWLHSFDEVTGWSISDST